MACRRARVLPGLLRCAWTCLGRKDGTPKRGVGLPWKGVAARGGSVSFGIQYARMQWSMRRRGKRKDNAEARRAQRSAETLATRWSLENIGSSDIQKGL